MALANIRLQSGALTKFQNQLSSGVAVAKPSDGASVFARIFADKSTADRFDGYLATIGEATGTLDESVSTLQSANNILVRAKQVALEAANGDLDNATAETYAKEVDGLLANFLSTTNATADGRPLFGGTAAGPAFTVAETNAAGLPSRIEYAGTGEEQLALVGRDRTVATRIDGRDVFGKEGANPFEALMGLRDALRGPAGNRPAILNDRMADLDAARDAVGETMGAQSTTLASLESLQTRSTDLRLAAASRYSERQGTDYVDATIHLREMENLFQASLATSARVIQPSLLDFLN
jgi:flagellar hook-associated protein 3 FlgL